MYHYLINYIKTHTPIVPAEGPEHPNMLNPNIGSIVLILATILFAVSTQVTIPIISTLHPAVYFALVTFGSIVIYNLMSNSYISQLQNHYVWQTSNSLKKFSDNLVRYIEEENGIIQGNKAKREEYARNNPSHVYYMNIYPGRGGEPVQDLDKLYKNAIRHDALATVRIMESVSNPGKILFTDIGDLYPTHNDDGQIISVAYFPKSGN